MARWKLAHIAPIVDRSRSTSRATHSAAASTPSSSPSVSHAAKSPSASSQLERVASEVSPV